MVEHFKNYIQNKDNGNERNKWKNAIYATNINAAIVNEYSATRLLGTYDVSKIIENLYAMQQS